MTIRKRIAVTLVFVVMCSWISYEATGEEMKWPAHVRKDMYIPPSAKDVLYRSSDGVFKVFYRADVCYPAKGLIQEAAASMRSRGWDRMPYDPLNPGGYVPPDYPESDKSWRGFYPWTLYWRDSSADVIVYEYSYDVNDKLPPVEYFEAVKRSCLLKGMIVYFSADAFKKILEKIKIGEQ
jgi:hypothetical protein